MKRIMIIGAGAWGSALAVVAYRAGNHVTLWSRNAQVVSDINTHNRNELVLPGVFLDPAITATGDQSLVADADMVVMAVPAQHMRSVCIAVSDHLDQSTPLLLTAKGIERGSLLLGSEIVEEILPHNPVAILAGPNFAQEVVAGKPGATAIACTDPALGEMLMYAIGTSHFRPYLSTDVAGSQVGGAIKNVVAIACGITQGRDMGENAQAALVTRGLTEMARLARAKGGRLETVMGLSGVGDLMLTCMGSMSRNKRLGIRLGEGKTLEELTAGNTSTVEGVPTAESAMQLAERYGVDMPICRAVHTILHQGAAIDETITTLLNRPFATEW